MSHFAVPHYLAHHRADGSALLGHGHVVDVVVEHGQQLPHHVKFHPCQNPFVRKAFQFPDAGTQGGILCIQFLDALFQVDSSGAVAEVSQGIDQGIDFPLRLGLLFAQGGKLGLKLGAVACVGADFAFSNCFIKSLEWSARCLTCSQMAASSKLPLAFRTLHNSLRLRSFSLHI